MCAFPIAGPRSRRQFLGSAATAGALLLPSAPAFGEEKKEQGEEDISTNEDLMREHGILKRVLIAYDEIIRRIRAGQDFPPDTVTGGATSFANSSRSITKSWKKTTCSRASARPASWSTW